jgi:hypothetical protein
MKGFLGNRLSVAGVIAAGIGASLCVVVAALGQSAEPQARVVEAVQSDKVVTLRGNVHPMARPANDRGLLADQQPITKIHVLLQRSAAQETALQQLMAQQLDSSSPKFHAWLTPQEFGQQFGPADSDVQAVKNWLTSQGFTGLKVNNGKTLIEFDGTAGQVRNAFHSEVHRLSVRGEEHFANMQEPQIPAALAQVVSGVVGLHNFRPKPMLRRVGKFQRNAFTGEVTPLFTFTDVNGTFFGVGPVDFAKIYSVPSAFNGTGVGVAIVGRTNINIQDARDFRIIFGLPAKDPEIILNGPDPGVVSSSEEGEADLDVEWSGAVAPGADIKLVVSETSQSDGTDGVDASAIYIVDNNIAPVLSESFGSCEADLGTAGNAFYSALWQQAAAQGISVMVSAGDSGSAACDPPSANPNESAASQGLGVSGIASTQYNVAMGGTDFDQSGNQGSFWNTADTSTTPPVPASAKGYIPEMAWNDSCASGGSVTGCGNASASTDTNLNFIAGGGGPSSVNAKPSWQSGVTGVPSDGKRDLPDVSLFASDGGPTDATGKSTIKSFYIVCQSDQDIAGDTGCNLTKFVSMPSTGPFHDFQAVGGTSAAAPTFAGIIALVIQKTGQRQGNANFVLYSLARNEALANCNSSSFTNPSSVPPSSCAFLDVTKGNISVACSAGTANCSKTGSSGFGVMATSTGGSTLAYSAGTGYDLATGLGSVNVTNLLNAWSALSRPDASAALATSTTFPIAHGTTAHFTVTVTPSAATGDVSLTGGPSATQTQGIGPFTLSSGTVSISTGMLPGGTYSLKAHYGGDATHGGSDSNAISVTVNKESSLTRTSLITFDSAGNIVSSNATSAAYGSPYILRVDVTNGSGLLCYSLNSAGQPVRTLGCPSGTVSLTDSGAALDGGSFALNATGYLEDQAIQFPAGSHKIAAAYAGDNSFTGSTSATNTISITQATTTTAANSSATSIASGGTVTLTAIVSSNSNAAQGPTGTVQFMNGGSNLGAAAATCMPAGATSSAGASCTATLTTAISSLPPGIIDIRPRNTPFVFLAWLAAVLAMLSLVLAAKLAARRKQYAYAGLAFFLVAVAAIAGCGGGSSSSGGGSSRSVTAKYSGDTNYAGSTGSTTITVH